MLNDDHAIKLNRKRPITGFSLAELLSSLVILGVIATFSIPKVLYSTQNRQYDAIAKEAIAAVSAAYMEYSYMQGSNPSTTLEQVLASKLNYIRVDSTGEMIDSKPTEWGLTCDMWNKCWRLANGATLYWWNGKSFGGTSPVHSVHFYIDPDSTYSGTNNGQGKAIEVFLYFNGRLTSRCCIDPATTDGDGGFYGPDTNLDPSWFHW